MSFDIADLSPIELSIQIESLVKEIQDIALSNDVNHCFELFSVLRHITFIVAFGGPATLVSLMGLLISAANSLQIEDTGVVLARLSSDLTDLRSSQQS